MAALAPGILVELINRMKAGVTKPAGEYRNSTLQVSDIVPADLDQKSLLPKRGFCIKLSDSSHSIYVRLPYDQDDLVMSNRLQLGQFLHVDRLDPGSPIPIVRGARPIPGRRPLVGTPKTLMGLRGEHDRVKINPQFSAPVRGSRGLAMKKAEAVGSPPRNLKPVPLDFDKCPLVRRSCADVGSCRRKSLEKSSLPSLNFLPRKLDLLEKEAIRQQETVQKIAHKAVRDASAADTIVHSLETFSTLTKSANVDSPGPCFDQFLEFHTQMASLQAVEDVDSNRTAREQPIPRKHLRSASFDDARNRAQKSLLPHYNNKPLTGGQKAIPTRHLRSMSMDNREPAAYSRLAKEITEEAGKWFMEFLEKALEKKKMMMMTNGEGWRVPERVLMEVMKWVEVEQSGHPRAAAVARKLRIKMKTP